jgi:hypothetical protein
MDPGWGPVVAAAGDTGSTPQGARHRRLQLRWWPLPGMPAAPPRGPAIDISNFGGGRCRTCQEHPTGGLPLTSLTLVVAVVGPAASTPQGACHRHLQLQWWPLSDIPPATLGARHRRLKPQWWPLPDMPPAPPRGPAIDVFNFGGGRCRACRQHPLGGPPSTSSTSMVAAAGHAGGTLHGARHQRLQHRWWPLSGMSTAPPGGPPSKSPTSVVAAAGHAASTPQGVRHRHLQL